MFGRALHLLLLVGAVALPAGAQPARQPPDVEALLARIDDLYRSKSSIARIELVVVNPRTTRSLRLQAWTRGEEEVLVVIEAPPSAGVTPAMCNVSTRRAAGGSRQDGMPTCGPGPVRQPSRALLSPTAPPGIWAA